MVAVAVEALKRSPRFMSLCCSLALLAQTDASFTVALAVP